MAWQPRHQQQILDTLAYFDRFDYPLTLAEIRHWSARRGFNPIRLRHPELNPIRGFYFLPGRSHLVKLRQERERISRDKWKIAQAVGEKLKKFPTLAAVFVTGALAMNNSPVDDDIDLMLVTYPNCLWLTRPFVDLYLYFKSLRRRPGQTSAPNKICPNLWLDTCHLTISDRSLRTAHEVLQAKVLWDRGGVHYQFLKQNFWVRDYLPVAYREGGNSVRASRRQEVAPKGQQGLNSILAVVNAIFFMVQYVYMWPKKTTERVGLGYAFFHPRR